MYPEKLQNTFLNIYKKYRENFVLKFFLTFFSFFYFLIYKTRLILYRLNILKKYSVKVPVISIGNISCGGTGKTPVTIELAKYLINKGLKVAILSRGYKRKVYNNGLRDLLLVSDGKEILSDYDLSGDEPYLIAKKVPAAIVIVGKDRLKAANQAIKLGAQIIILDDGFQHLRINRAENILILDSDDLDDHLLPQGNLRELPDSINRATAIVINKSSQLKLHIKDKPIIEKTYKAKTIKGINIKKSLSIEDAKKEKFIAFCGIANPKSFLETLATVEINPVHFIEFNDHHFYTYKDIEKLLKISCELKIENFICTEKDAVKLETLCESIPATFWALEVEIEWNISNPFERLLVNRSNP